MRGELRRGEDSVRLTSTEQALMRVFSRQPNEAVSRSRLAEELGGTQGEVQERAVDVQITRLRRKIEKRSQEPALSADRARGRIHADAGLRSGGTYPRPTGDGKSFTFLGNSA